MEIKSFCYKPLIILQLLLLQPKLAYPDCLLYIPGCDYMAQTESMKKTHQKQLTLNNFKSHFNVDM